MKAFLAVPLAVGAFGKVCTSQKKYPIELVIVQDATASFTDDFSQMKNKQLSQLATLFKSYPGTRFGVVSFRDKPIDPWGYPLTDYCVKYETPLSEDFKVVEQVYSTMKSTGGGDEYENSFGALISAALSPQIGWGAKGSAPGGMDYTKIVLLVTDALPHSATDANPKNLAAHNGQPDDTDPSKCAKMWYPSPQQTGAALKKQGIYLLSLIQGGSRNIAGWQWFNDEILKQPKEFVQTLSADSSNFSKILQNVMAFVDQVECSDDTPTSLPNGGGDVLCPPAVPPMPEICRQYLNELLQH